MSMFNKGPWYTFGITDDTVQVAVGRDFDQKTNISGKLFCADKNQSTVQELKKNFPKKIFG